jgi:nucleotide-binding universal stress UspA family protein
MQKKILIAVENSPNTNRLLDYVAGVSYVIKELTYTIVTIQPPISQFMIEDAKREASVYTQLQGVKRKNEAAAQRLLESCKERLVRRGIEEERIDLFTQPRKIGLARDILEKAEHGLYDAILLARRGLTKTQQLFMGSVSSKIVHNAARIPVWIVDGEVTSKKILVAVDGSAASLRSVDHLAFMVGGNPEVEVVLFHVTPKLGDFCTINFDDEPAHDLETAFLEMNQQCIDNFYAQAQNILHEAGLMEQQIKVKTKTTTWGVAKAIKEEARRGKYGTVIIGRSGMHKSFFMGNISSKVIQSLTNCALWVTI